MAIPYQSSPIFPKLSFIARLTQMGLKKDKHYI